MSEFLNVKSWDSSSTYSDNFKMTTKYTDLGSPDFNKSILGIILNLSVSNESTDISHSSFKISIKYRTSPNDNFENMSTFNSSYSPTNVNKGNIQSIKIFSKPIKNILNIQLQIKGSSIRNDFGINDFGLVFRTYRDSNMVSLDENR